MRNTEARRYARWSAAIAILLALAVAGVYLHRVWQVKQAEKEAPPAVPSTVEQSSAEFSFSKVEGQRTIYTVRASHATEFKESNRNLLENVAITVYGRKGDRNDTLHTSECDFIPSTGRISCAGEVQISLQAPGATQATANAIQVVTSNVSFDRDSGEAWTDKPVTFHWPGGEGRAVGVQYDSNAGTLRLNHSVETTLTTSPLANPQGPKAAGETAVHLTGDSMLFRTEVRTVQVQGSVDARQATDELTAESLLLELDETFHARRLVASGHARMRDSNAPGPMALEADQITAALTPAGSVETIVAAGNVHGSRSTPSGEDGIEAGRVQVELANRQNMPRLLSAGGGVILTSRSASANGGTRRVETEALELHFSNGSRPGKSLLESVNTLAPAQIEWQNIATSHGMPAKQTIRMHGQQIILRFDGENQLQQLVNSGDVDVTRQLGEGPEQTTTSRELTAKFAGAGEWSTIDQTGDVRFREGLYTGQSEHAHVDRATNTVTLTGSVILADGTTRTTAQSAVFNQSSDELHADGNVLTSQLTTAKGDLTNFASEPAHISAEHLVGDAARGHATYSGNGRLWQGNSVIEADTIELDNPSHTVTARGHVRGVFPQAARNPKGVQATGLPSTRATELWHVRGGLLTYSEAESRARLEQDATAESAEGSIHAHQMDLYFASSGAASSAKQLSRAVANGDVIIRQGDRRATSNRAEYAAAEGKFVLSEGKPTLYDSTGDTTSGGQLTFFLADDRIVVDSEEGSRTVTLHRVEK